MGNVCIYTFEWNILCVQFPICSLLEKVVATILWLRAQSCSLCVRCGGGRGATLASAMQLE